MKLIANFSLRNMLVVPYVVLILLLAVISGALSYHSGRDAIDTWSSQLLIETVERIKQAVDQHVAGSAAVLEVAFPRGVPAPTSFEDSLDSLRTRFWLATSVHRDPNNYAYFGDRDGHFFGLMRHSESEAELRLRRKGEGPRSIYRFSGIRGGLGEPVVETRIFEPRQRPWFLAAQSTPLHTWTSIYIDFKTAELVATRARRVNNAAGDFQGVVATDLSLRQVDMFLRKLALSKNGIAMVVENDGNLVGVSRGPHLTGTPGHNPQRLKASDSPEPLVAATYKAVKRLIDDNNGEKAKTAVFKTSEGDLVQVGYSRLQDDAGLDWLVMVAVPRHDFQKEVEDNFRTNIYLGVISAICVTLLGLLVLSVIARELKKLALAAQRIGEGDLETGLDTHRRDEIGQLAKSFAEMQSRLLTDQLTGVANREAIIRHIEERILQHRRRGDARPFVVLFADLNDFKQINDQFGHDIGDQVLREFAKRIKTTVRSQDTVARYAGDEFIILLDSVEFDSDGEAARQHLEEVLRQPLECLRGLNLKMPQAGATIGMAVYPDDGLDVDTLIKAADTDMYARKQAGKGYAG